MWGPHHHLAVALGAVWGALAVALGGVRGTLSAVCDAHLALALFVTSNLCLAVALRDIHLVRRTNL